MLIEYNRFRLDLEVIDEIHLPPYKGSTIRGGFGTQFRRIVCALRRESCEDCLLKERCVYAYVFETLAPADRNVLGRVKSAPHPFVIEPPEERKGIYLKDEVLSFNLVLVGRAVEYLPYFIYTFDELGKSGIGRGRGRYRLRSVANIPFAGKEGLVYEHETKTIKSVSPDLIDLSEAVRSVENGPIHAAEDRQTVKLTFFTPTRIKYNGSLTKDLDFHILMRQLLRRLFLLWHFHCYRNAAGTRSEDSYHRTLIRLAEGVKVQNSSLRWHDWERYSHRQKGRMKLGGFVGDITYSGTIAPFLPFLEAGSILHVGKGTSFGLGRYGVGTE